MSTVYSNTHDLRVWTRALIAVSRPGCCHEDGPDTTAGVRWKYADRQPTRTNQLCGICGYVNGTKEEDADRLVGECRR